jgi:hypothetical protein
MRCLIGWWWWWSYFDDHWVFIFTLRARWWGIVIIVVGGRWSTATGGGCWGRWWWASRHCCRVRVWHLSLFMIELCLMMMVSLAPAEIRSEFWSSSFFFYFWGFFWLLEKLVRDLWVVFEFWMNDQRGWWQLQGSCLLMKSDRRMSVLDWIVIFKTDDDQVGWQSSDLVSVSVVVVGSGCGRGKKSRCKWWSMRFWGEVVVVKCSFLFWVVLTVFITEQPFIPM